MIYDVISKVDLKKVLQYYKKYHLLDVLSDFNDGYEKNVATHVDYHL